MDDFKLRANRFLKEFNGIKEKYGVRIEDWGTYGDATYYIVDKEEVEYNMKNGINFDPDS